MDEQSSEWRALRAFVDDFQDSLSSDDSDPRDRGRQSELMRCSSVAGAADAAEPSQGRRNPQQRDELRHLRRQARALAFRLDGLKRVKERRSGSQHASQHQTETALVPSATTGKNAAAVVRLWERLAQRQYEQRQRAEMENARLRRLLMEQFRLTKSLERTLMRRTYPVVPFPASDTARHRRGRVDDATIEADLTAALPRLYDQLDAVFVDPRFQTVETHFSDRHVQLEAKAGTFFRYISAEVLPFNLETTTDVLWQFFHSQHIGQDENVDRTDDIVVKTFCTRFSGHIEMHGKFVTRRYIEPTRVVIVSAARVEPLDSTELRTSDVVFWEYAWRILQRPLNRRVFSAEMVATQVQCHTVFAVSKVLNKSAAEYVAKMAHALVETGERITENLFLQLR